MLYKIGSHLRILKTASSATDLLTDVPMTEKAPGASTVIEPKHSDFLYYRARAISAGDQGPLQRDGSRGWAYNGNFDYFPRKELESSYDTFRGRNIFLDHNSESSLYSIGKIIDAVPVDDPETGEFYIELVGKIDRTLHPEICRKIETGELNSTSMGCSVDDSMCSICGNVLHSDADEKCEHMGMNLGKKFPAEIDLPEYNIRKGDMVPCFSINSGIVFNEDSIVGVPADPTAVIKTVLSNMKSRLNKKASLSKDEQLDLAAQMEKLFSKLDDTTKISLKAEFCGICPPVEKESSMADKNVTPNEEQKKILSKLSALEMEQLESYVAHKTKKANEIVTKEVVADAVAKEESFLSKIVAKVKDALSKEDKTVSAKFQEDKNNVLDSTWSVNEGDTCVLEASLKDIWGAQFALLSFEDQKWATSEAYGKEVVSRYTKEGIAKLADLWDVTHKLSKTASEPKLGPSGTYAKPTTGTDNKKHNYPTNIPASKPEGTKLTPGKGSSNDWSDKDVKTEYKLDMPGQEAGQKGPAAPKPMDVKTDYTISKPEGKKLNPKNPDEKDAKKSEKEVETDYVAAGTEAMEAEDKSEKKSFKHQNSMVKWSALSGEAQDFIKKHVEKHMKEDGMERAQAVAAAYSEARKKGFEVPSKESSTLPVGTKVFGDVPVESSKESTLPEGSKQIGDVPDESVEKLASQETIMEKKAAEKPVESVDGTTLPTGHKEIGDKAEGSVKGDTEPKGSNPSGEPDMSVKDGKGKKTTDLTKAPEESVKGTTIEHDSKTSGDKAEQSSQGDTEPKGAKRDAEPDMAVNKSAASEMPMPEDHTQEEVKVEEKPMDLPMGEHKEEAPHTEEVSAFDAAEKIEVGDGYSARKDPASKEIIVEKDGQEVKRLPDGFGKDATEVLKLMKAVLGLPAEGETPAGPDIMAPKQEGVADEMKVEEHPALEEAHEDELGIKESALKVKEAELIKKEAALKAKEDATAKEEATKKFASILQARSERCRKIVAELVEKEQLSYDKQVYEAELQSGAHLLDARKKAFEAAITAKMKEFIALNDDGLTVMEATVNSIKAPVTGTTKKASRLFVSPQYTEQMSEDEEISKIFKTMGTNNRPQ